MKEKIFDAYDNGGKIRITCNNDALTTYLLIDFNNDSEALIQENNDEVCIHYNEDEIFINTSKFEFVDDDNDGYYKHEDSTIIYFN